MHQYEELGIKLDQLINSDSNGRGVAKKLYPYAFEKAGEPLVYKAARELVENSDKGSPVLIMTGFRTPPLYVQETDGPLGAASISRAFSICLNAKPIILTEQDERSLRIVRAAVEGAGLKISPLEDLLRGDQDLSASVVGFTHSEEYAEEDAKRLIDEVNPRAVIAVEKAGRNFKGVYHSMSGLNVSKYHAKVEYIVDEARKKGILTIGIGDGGNEVGMGAIEDAVRKHVPYGDVCRCPCRGGIASSSKVDVLITSSISNWGGYALSGMISKILEKPNGIHDPEAEELMFSLVAKEGAVDGIKGKAGKSADGLGVEAHKSVLMLIREMLF
ncbi:MAG: hypothetical protein C0179_03400 [Fervidicoccus sp.]|nr:MAG: hypothetical protein C0179_03400 [Fervidicoccus sp.]